MRSDKGVIVEDLHSKNIQRVWVDLYRCLQISLEDYLQMLGERGNDKMPDFKNVPEEEGVEAMRFNMHRSINALGCIYQERELGWELSEEEIFENAQKLELNI